MSNSGAAMIQAAVRKNADLREKDASVRFHDMKILNQDDHNSLQCLHLSQEFSLSWFVKTIILHYNCATKHPSIVHFGT